ncbi:Aldehyde dehydrogenase 8 member A1 [Quaeritorhiza haematococci]|nr:Aldehyde dehydrogenase 8 member A1 [Quaeritorhiza haematococci]
MTVRTLQNFIDDEFRDPTSGARIDSFNPANGQVHALVPDSTAEDVEEAVRAAEKAFPSWSKTSRAKRSEYMLRIADLLEKRLDEFALAESQDQGKPVSLARTVDIPRAIYNFRFFSSYILHLEEKATELDGVALNFTQKYPVGVVGIWRAIE